VTSSGLKVGIPEVEFQKFPHVYQSAAKVRQFTRKALLFLSQ